MNWSTTLVAGGLLAFMTTAGGCLITSSESFQETGVPVSRSTLNQVQPGVTTEAWLVASLGEPSQRTAVPDDENVSVLRYDHIVTKSGSGTVFLLFAGSSNRRQISRTYFEVTDGVVSRYWTED